MSNQYIIRNITNKNILISDISGIPLLESEKCYDLLGCTSLDKIESSKQLFYAIEKKWLKKENYKEESIDIQEESIDIQEESIDINEEDKLKNKIVSISALSERIFKLEENQNTLNCRISILEEKTDNIFFIDPNKKDEEEIMEEIEEAKGNIEKYKQFISEETKKIKDLTDE